MSNRILIAPGELRDAARTYLAAGEALRGVDQRLRVQPPSMPGHLESEVVGRLASIARDLSEQDQYLRDEANELIRRAGLAEKADGPFELLVLGLLEMLGIGGVRGLEKSFVSGLGRGDREDREVARDQRLRDPPGGGDGLDFGRGFNFNNDWAGREILQRYLRGGGDWTITNDPDWTKYMESNPSLTSQLNTLVQRQALDAFDKRGMQPNSASFYSQQPMEIENGEGIVGYQYLHGTNADVGGFEFSGSTNLTKVPDGYEVRVPATYTWNDIIDPNPQYGTDKWKSWLAEAGTLGQADKYTIRLTWSGEATVHLDENGRVLSVQGYPGDH